jgi:hypothetical protein
MPGCRVSFCCEITRNDKGFRCLQRATVIRAARSPERAAAAAKRRFARREGVRDWSVHADALEVEPLDPEPGDAASKSR